MKHVLRLLVLLCIPSWLFAQNITVQLTDAEGQQVEVLNACQYDEVKVFADVQIDGLPAMNEELMFIWTVAQGGPSGMGLDSLILNMDISAGTTVALQVLNESSGQSAADQLEITVSGAPDASSFLQNMPQAMNLGEVLEVEASSDPADAGYIAPFEGLFVDSLFVYDQGFLPDGSGASYEYLLEVSGAEAGTVLNSSDDLPSLIASLEHSYMGDLDIELTCPNGTTVLVQGQGDGSCNLGIPWATAGVDGQSSNITPGEGYLYEWNLEATISLEEGCEPDSFPLGDDTTFYNDFSAIPGAYAPDDDLSELIGCPVNGQWAITITDNIGADNGWIFLWGLQFPDELFFDQLGYQTSVVNLEWAAHPSLSSTGGSATITPTEIGPLELELLVNDDHGCQYEIPYLIDVWDPNKLDEWALEGIDIRRDGDRFLLTDVQGHGLLLFEAWDISGRRVQDETFSRQMDFPIDRDAIYLIRVSDIDGKVWTTKLSGL